MVRWVWRTGKGVGVIVDVGGVVDVGDGAEGKATWVERWVP